jgi:hypothetical protein
MEEVDALVIASSSSSNQAIPPWTKRNSFNGSAVYPPMLLSTRSDLFNLAATRYCMHSSRPPCTDQYLLNLTWIVVRRLEHSLSLE